MNENVWMSIKISLKFIPKVLINNIPSSIGWNNGLVPTRHKPLSEPMMIILLMHKRITRTQWVKSFNTKWVKIITDHLLIIQLHCFKEQIHDTRWVNNGITRLIIGVLIQSINEIKFSTWFALSYPIHSEHHDVSNPRQLDYFFQQLGQVRDEESIIVLYYWDFCKWNPWWLVLPLPKDQ